MTICSTHPTSSLGERTHGRTYALAAVVCILPAFLTSLSSAWAADLNPTRFVTANGMTVLFLEQHYLPTVELHALIKIGSAHDPQEKAGLANLTANLLDEGTTITMRKWRVRDELELLRERRERRQAT